MSDWPRAGIAALLKHALPQARLLDLEPLGGGYANTVLRAQLSGPVSSAVVRLWRRDPASCETELGVLERVRPLLPVPRVLAADPGGELCGLPAALQEDVPGVRADLALAAATPAEAQEIGALLGGAFASLREITFEDAGFFEDRQLSVRPMPIEPASQQLLAFAEPPIWSGAARAALGEAVQRGWWALIEESAPLLDRQTGWPALVHADANPKNVLLRRSERGWALAAVLDWEFAFAGSNLMDLGNLLRFEPRGGSPFMEGVVRGWGEPLPPDALSVARTLDVFSLCGFVASDQNALHGQVVALVRRCVREGRL